MEFYAAKVSQIWWMKNLFEKKNSSAKMSSYNLFEWSKYCKADIMISCMTEAIWKKNGLEVFEIGNGDQYLAQFTTNDVESMNAELKWCFACKLPIDQFIKKLKMIVDVQENQYLDAISVININTLPLAANGLCGMQWIVNFIRNSFPEKASYLQASL